MIRVLSFVLIGWLLTGSMASAQISSEPESKPPIEVKLSATSLMVCIGSTLPLQLELANRGAEDFQVDKFDIWNHFKYGFIGDRTIDRGGGMGSSCSHCPPEPVVIAHDQTYQTSFNFDLKHDFFKDAGKYTIKVTIAGVSSNELEFELFSCQ